MILLIKTRVTLNNGFIQKLILRGPEMSSERLAILANFIRLLIDRLGYKFNIEEEFEKRFRLQKYVYLAKFFGIDLGYSYNLYMHGPYSSDLADDYYELSRWGVLPSSEESLLTKGFRIDEFIEFVKNRDDEWLEAATTLLDVWHANKEIGMDIDRLIEHVSSIKPHIKTSKIEAIAKELLKRNLLSS